MVICKTLEGKGDCVGLTQKKVLRGAIWRVQVAIFATFARSGGVDVTRVEGVERVKDGAPHPQQARPKNSLLTES